MTKTYHVSLIVEILACVQVDDDCPENAISMMARSEAVSLFPTGQGDVSLEIEHIEVGDIVKIAQEANDAR